MTFGEGQKMRMTLTFHTRVGSTNIRQYSSYQLAFFIMKC